MKSEDGHRVLAGSSRSVSLRPNEKCFLVVPSDSRKRAKRMIARSQQRRAEVMSQLLACPADQLIHHLDRSTIRAAMWTLIEDFLDGQRPEGRTGRTRPPSKTLKMA